MRPAGSIRPLRVFINCNQRLGGGSGGVEQFVTGLVHGLAELGSDHEFLLGIAGGDEDWLRPHLGPSMHFVSYSARSGTRFRFAVEARIRAKLSPYKRKLQALLGRAPRSNAGLGRLVDSLAPDVCHFPWQQWFPTRAPSILNLHDLQHLHFPEFFDAEELERRKPWQSWARRADLLAATSDWTARDFVEQLGVPLEKVRVVVGASYLELVREPSPALLDELRSRFALPPVFGLYPATTWKHKNHRALLHALHAQRDLGVGIICTGSATAEWPKVEEEARRLGLQDRFRMVGFVSPEDLKGLYRLASFVIVPSLFEGGGAGPMYEALAESVPLACSDLASIPQAVRDAALLFDPRSIDAIIEALRRLVKDRVLREQLLMAGKQAAARLTVRTFARGYLELYEELAEVGAPSRGTRDG